jgi:hypothetical protein
MKEFLFYAAGHPAGICASVLLRVSVCEGGTLKLRKYTQTYNEEGEVLFNGYHFKGGNKQSARVVHNLQPGLLNHLSGIAVIIDHEAAR